MSRPAKTTTTHAGHVATIGTPAADLLSKYEAALVQAEETERSGARPILADLRRTAANELLIQAMLADGYVGFAGRDVVVTIPSRLWSEWLAEGDCAGESRREDVEYWYNVPTRPTDLHPGGRVYVVAYGRVRGYAPLHRIDPDPHNPRGCLLIRRGGAVAVTIPGRVQGFQGYRYRWWSQDIDVPFPDWRTP